MGQRLSDTEALLWSLGKDPNLASTMGLILMLDGSPDRDRVRRTLATTVAAVDRLQQRIVDPSSEPSPRIGDALGGPPGGSRPEWVVDHDFELDHHLRFSRLVGRGKGAASEADLRAAAVRIINDPFDLGRPLWQFHLVSGLARGRSALIGKVHHSISDGIGLLRLAANLLEFEPDATPPDEVDLAAVFRRPTRAADGTPSTNGTGDGSSDDRRSDDALTPGNTPENEADGEDESGSTDGLFDRLQAATRSLGSLPSPAQLVEAGVEVVNSARALTAQLPKTEASPLWAERSRNRRLELVSLPADGLKRRAAELEVTVNTLFVAACAEAAIAYHRAHEVDIESVSATVVVGTRSPDAGGDPVGDAVQGALDENAFIPVAIRIPAAGAEPKDRLHLIRDEVRTRRERLTDSGDLLNAIGTLTGLVPTSITANLVLQQAAKVDFATSNIPGSPVPTWFAGVPIRGLHPVGPVSGTAFNVTLLTFDATAHIGIHLDPSAVTDGALLQRSLRDGFADFGVARR